MSAPSTYAVEFYLLDPAKIAQTKGREAAVIMKITGLVQGTSFDTDELNARDGSRLINRNLARLTHRKAQAAALVQAATEAGTTLMFYCSRCGRKFKPNECQTCGIGFQIADSLESVVGAFPGIPAKVVAYAKQQRHVFTHEPPRA